MLLQFQSVFLLAHCHTIMTYWHTWIRNSRHVLPTQTSFSILLNTCHIHTFTNWWKRLLWKVPTANLEQSGVPYLAKGSLDMQPGEPENQTSDLPITGKLALPAEPQPSSPPDGNNMRKQLVDIPPPCLSSVNMAAHCQLYWISSVSLKRELEKKKAPVILPHRIISQVPAVAAFYLILDQLTHWMSCMDESMNL